MNFFFADQFFQETLSNKEKDSDTGRLDIESFSLSFCTRCISGENSKLPEYAILLLNSVFSFNSFFWETERSFQEQGGSVSLVPHQASSSTLEMVDGQFLPLHNPQQTLWSVLTSDHRCLMSNLTASLAYLPGNSPHLGRSWVIERFLNGCDNSNPNARGIRRKFWGWLDVKLTVATESQYGHAQQSCSGISAPECLTVSFIQPAST